MGASQARHAAAAHLRATGASARPPQLQRRRRCGPGAPASERVGGSGGAERPGLNIVRQCDSRRGNLPAHRRSTVRKSVSRVPYEASNSSRRGMTTRSIAGPSAAGTARRKTSRIKRLARFLCTAFPSFLDATIPSLAVPVSLGAASIVRNRPCARWPASKTRWNSAFRRIRRSGPKRAAPPGCCMDRRPARPAWAAAIRTRKPSGACAPWRGAASERAARSWCSSARETRECACGGGGSAETYASWYRNPCNEQSVSGET
jgi:hypothetical protein